MNKINKKNNNLLTIYISVGVILHIISVYFSIGFYSDDEHFQILEPAAYLLGINEIIIDDPSGNYWEWEHEVRMRPWSQPYIYYQIINILKFFGINDPFSWTFFLRLISSLFGFLSIFYLFITVKDDFFKKNNHFNYLLFFTFWFFPFLHSRTSSENLSITIFIIAFCLLYSFIKSKKIQINYFTIFISSFLMGLAMVFKFNAIFTVLPFFLWFLFYRFNFLILSLMGLSIVLALLLGLYVDYINWGSTQFYNTYYQFYKHNLVTGTFDTFGIQPWWYYITSTILELAPLLSVFFIISIMIFWIRNPRNIFSWITFFSLIFFSSFGHKETRYIFSIYFFAPLFISYFFEKYSHIKFQNTLKTIIILSNIIFLSLTLFTPAKNKVGVYYYLYNNFNNKDEVYYIENNPYLINKMEPYLYTSFLPKIDQLKQINLIKSRSWIVTNIYDSYNYILSNHINCKLKYSTYPDKIMNLNNNWRRLKLNWYIIYCQ